MTNVSIGDKIGKILRVFRSGDAGGAVTSVNGKTGDVTVDVPSAATDADVSNGTSSDRYISPSTNVKSTYYGIIRNAQNLSLDSANQKSVQSWLGTNELTFTFSDGSTRKFNFVCNEIL